MTTAADIVTRAFRRLGLKAEDTALSADEAAHGLDVLNSMMSAFRLDAINYTHATMDSDDPFPLGAEFVAPVVSMLAWHLGPDYSVQPPVDYDAARRALQAAMPVPLTRMSTDPVLMRRSPSRYWTR